MPRVYRSAELSPDRKYRRRLDRWWAEGPRVAWLMCNPSLADEVRDDPTVRKCVGFTMRWGFPGLTIINPFDLVCTNPADLVLSQYPATLQNGIAIGKVARAARLLVVAWGCEDTASIWHCPFAALASRVLEHRATHQGSRIARC